MKHRVLSLGAGVQSTTLYLMAIDGEIPTFDLCVFADTQAEPAAVMNHLKWLQSLNGPQIVITTAGSLTEAIDLRQDDGSPLPGQSGRNVLIPGFSLDETTGKRGMIPRQCTRDFKIRPIERALKQHLFGLESRQHFPRNHRIEQVLGLSYDEPKRVIRVRQRFAEKGERHTVDLPLWDLELTRADCIKYLKGRVPHQTPRSACVYCPYKSDAEWRDLKENHPEDWATAVEFDRQFRNAGRPNCKRYLHSSCQPLEFVDLTKAAPNGADRSQFINECEGMCGN